MTIIWKDLDYDLTRNTYDDLELKTDLNSVKQAIKTVVLTAQGERSRYQNPYFGSRVRKLLFEKFDNITAAKIKEEIEVAINDWEPRVSLISVEAEANDEDHTFDISIYYKIKHLDIIDELIFQLSVIE